MRLCMAAAYDIQNQRSWSGTPFSLYQAMKIQVNEVQTLNLSQYHTAWNTKINRLRNTDLCETIRSKERVSKVGLSDNNPLNSAILQKKCSAEDFDAVLEFGGFLPKKGLPPYFVYSDSSHDLALDYYNQYGYLPFGHQEDALDKIRRSAEFAREIYQKADGVFCMSQWMADSMIHTSGVDPKKVHVVYAGANWHDVNVTFPDKYKSIRGKKEIHLLLVGVTFEGKGVDLALQAVAKLNRESDKTFYLHVCGIRTPFEHDAHVINHGFTPKDELLRLWNDCDVFVLPSRFDCFGISFVEAMYFGMPCVGRKICAMPEIIDEGVNGTLISPQDDAAELAQCIYEIVRDDDQYEAFSASAMQKAKQFSWSKVAQDMALVMGR